MGEGSLYRELMLLLLMGSPCRVPRGLGSVGVQLTQHGALLLSGRRGGQKAFHSRSANSRESSSDKGQAVWQAPSAPSSRKKILEIQVPDKGKPPNFLTRDASLRELHCKLHTHGDPRGRVKQMRLPPCTSPGSFRCLIRGVSQNCVRITEISPMRSFCRLRRKRLGKSLGPGGECGRKAAAERNGRKHTTKSGARGLI